MYSFNTRKIHKYNTSSKIKQVMKNIKVYRNLWNSIRVSRKMDDFVKHINIKHDLINFT